MRRTLIAATVYFLILFALGFVLGTIRVLFIAPRVGELAATAAELPLMLTAANFICRWTIRRGQVTAKLSYRWAMVGWFFILLVVLEALLGQALFGRTIAEQWAALTTAAGILGLSAQIVAALLPVMIERTVSRDT